MSSNRGDGVSTSEVAKMLPESAREDQLDSRFEVANPQRSAAESLWNIRQRSARGCSRLRRWAIVASSLGRTVGRVHGHTAMQIPQDAVSAK